MEVDRILAGGPENGFDIDGYGFEFAVAFEKIEGVDEVVDRADIEVAGHRGFFRVLSWHDHAFNATSPCLNGHREDPTDGSNGTVKSEFAENDVVVENIFGNASPDGKKADCDGEVEASAFLLDISGGEVDGDVVPRELSTGVQDGRFHPIVALANGVVRKTHEGKFGNLAWLNVGFGVDEIGVDSESGATGDA